MANPPCMSGDGCDDAVTCRFLQPAAYRAPFDRACQLITTKRIGAPNEGGHRTGRFRSVKQVPQNLCDRHSQRENDQSMSDAALLAWVIGQRRFTAPRLIGAIG